MTLYVVSSNMPGYLPNDDNPFIGHGDAETLVSVLADLIVRDGESSIESIMLAPDDYATEQEWNEASSGDAGMVELWQPRKEAYREALQDTERALALGIEFVYGYRVNWSDTPSGMVYFIQATDATHCSDESCDECYETLEA